MAEHEMAHSGMRSVTSEGVLVLVVAVAVALHFVGLENLFERTKTRSQRLPWGEQAGEVALAVWKE